MNDLKKQRLLRILGKHTKELGVKRCKLFALFQLENKQFFDELTNLCELAGVDSKTFNALMVIKFKHCAEGVANDNNA